MNTKRTVKSRKNIYVSRILNIVQAYTILVERKLLEDVHLEDRKGEYKIILQWL